MSVTLTLTDPLTTQSSTYMASFVLSFRYFDALSKGDTPPVKERLEFQLGQPLEKPLTQGLLAVLHKQVFPTLIGMSPHHFRLYSFLDGADM